MIVAYELEGSPLSDEHGGPVRLYVAPMYGYKSLQVARPHRAHEAASRRATGRSRGYDTDGWVGRSNGRDDDAT